jgi:hypothetical protein
MHIVTVECDGVERLGLLRTDGLVIVPPNEGPTPIEQLLDDSNGIATGTPSGIGGFRDPPITLATSDVVAAEIAAIGRVTNRCRTDKGS